MVQNLSIDADEAVNLLALDGGGIRGVSELLILNEMMRRVQHDQKLPELPRPCDYFDLIGGTSTGGLIALMLGRLRMNTIEALQAYNSLAQAIFSKENKKWKGQDGLFKATTLENKVKELVLQKKQGEHMLPLSTPSMSPPSTKGKAFVCAMPANNMEYPRRFRTYSVRENDSANCEIWEAARATSAAPTFFKRIAIGDGSGAKEEFIDGGLRCNNPIKQVLEEAGTVFGPDRKVGCLVSIGTGHPGAIGLARPDSFQKVLPTKLIGVVKKIATDCQNTANELSTRFKDHENFYFRFNVEHGAEGISLEEWEKMGELTEHTKAYLRKAEVSKTIDQIVDTLCHRRPIERTLGSLSGIPHSDAFSIGFSLSEVSEARYFVAREKELVDIHTVLSAGGSRQTVILHGMGGIGKTQITISYAKRHKRDYSAIFWLNSKDEDSLQQSFLRAMERIQREHPLTSGLATVNKDTSLNEVVNAVRRWLDRKGNTQWLLMYDNYDNPKLRESKDPLAFDIKSYFPDADHGSIIITTRLSQVDIGHRIEIRKLEEIQDSLRILSSTSSRSNVMDDGDAQQLAERLDGLPLALATAGAYLEQSATSFARYLQLYEESWLELQRNTPVLSPYDRALYSTWQLSYTHVQQQNPLSAKLLQLWAYFDNQDIWYELLRRAREESIGSSMDWVAELTKNEICFTTAARVLHNHGLIEVDKALEQDSTESRGYSMHSCVHSWTIHVLNQEWNVDMAKLALTTVAEHIPNEGSQHYWATQRRLIRHTARCWSFVVDGRVRDDGLAWGLGSFGNLYWNQDRMEEAEKMYRRALQGKEKAWGPEHTSTLDTVNNLAVLYADQGKIEEAEKMYQRALQGYEKAWGPEHTSTLDTVNNLANLYADRGKIEEAEKIYQRALQGKEKAWGPEHTSTLSTVNNLAVLYADQGKIEEAEKMYQRALQGKEKAWGPEHTSTLNTVNNLAVLYRNQGKIEEAEKMF